MRVRRSDIVARARLWLGTPFAHQQAAIGVSCDCIALPEAEGLYQGLLQKPFTRDYGRTPDPRRILTALRRHCFRLRSIDDRLPGDIGLFSWSGKGTHLGIFAPHNRVIHAYGLRTYGAVCEVVVAGHLYDGLRSVWRLPEIEDD